MKTQLNHQIHKIYLTQLTADFLNYKHGQIVGGYKIMIKHRIS